MLCLTGGSKANSVGLKRNFYLYIIAKYFRILLFEILVK